MDEPEEPRGIERFFRPFVEEPLLWPVLLVIVGHVVAFLVPVMLFSVRDRRPFAMAALLGLALLSVQGVRLEWRQRGRPGALGAILLTTWITSTVVAVAADRYGVF